MTQPEGDWDLVHGELMTFANPAIINATMWPSERTEHVSAGAGGG